MIQSINMQQAQYLTAREAAAELNVSRATLYAYVSRGLIRSEPSSSPRARLYRAEDVRALRDRKAPARQPADGSAAALQWGAPILESAITLITEADLFYRGRSATRLAESASLETVAALLWDCAGEDPFAGSLPPIPALQAPDGGLVGMDRCLALLAHAAPLDLRAFNQDPAGVARTGARLVRLLAAGMGGAAPDERPAHAILARGWGVDDRSDADLLRAALVLAADHELNASTFTVRCIASTGASPYAAVMGGLCALQGPRHGGATARVAALFDEAAATGNPRLAIARRLKRGDRISGFGHPLYPQGDPRAKVLLRMLLRRAPDSAGLAAATALADAVRELTDREPTIDFALVALARTLGLPAHAPIGLFAVGRCVGWIAHVLEQYAGGQLIRPRSRYIGDPPLPADDCGDSRA